MTRRYEVIRRRLATLERISLEREDGPLPPFDYEMAAEMLAGNVSVEEQLRLGLRPLVVVYDYNARGMPRSAPDQGDPAEGE